MSELRRVFDASLESPDCTPAMPFSDVNNLPCNSVECRVCPYTNTEGKLQQLIINNLIAYLMLIS